MKKLDKLMVKGFIPPFIVTFMIATFVLLMQFLWLYVDDLAGKGLGILIIFELLGYKSVGLIPMAMPLAILISSVMVFGNMGERYELSSFKSGGVSLVRVMAPIIFLGALAAWFSFFSSNYLIPVANLKFGSRMYDIQHQKPALNLEANVFNDDFNGFSIHIDKKYPDGHTIEDVLIYDHRDAGSGLLREIVAAEGEMYSSKDGKYFVLNLKDGHQYVEQKATKRGGGNKGQSYPFIRTKFKRWTKLFDLSEFNLSSTDSDVFKKHYKMLNISQLAEAVDSITISIDKKRVNISNFFANVFTPLEKDSTYITAQVKKTYNKEDGIMKDEQITEDTSREIKPLKEVIKEAMENKKTKKHQIDSQKEIIASPKTSKPLLQKVPPKPDLLQKKNMPKKRTPNKLPKYRGPTPLQQNLDSLEYYTTIAQTFPPTDLKRLYSKAKSSIRSIKGQSASAVRSIANIKETRVKYIFDLHTKYSLAVVCFIFVFIGAPMGAIVRKGGFGYPILIAIVFFILFIVLTIFCKKIAESFVLNPVLAAWLPGIILFPIGLVLTIKAMNDSKLLDPDRALNYLKKLFSKKHRLVNEIS